MSTSILTKHKEYKLDYLKAQTSITDDTSFDSLLYPVINQNLSSAHWTPFLVAKKAAELLSQNENDRILDIGSGVGKFCIAGALNSPAQFYGVEQRKHLYDLSNDIVKKLKLPNVQFIHSNITKIDFAGFHGFYFFNPFEENLLIQYKIDNEVQLEPLKYIEYMSYVKLEFSKLPVNTRIVTYHGISTLSIVIPECYRNESTHFNGKLSLWIKQ